MRRFLRSGERIQKMTFSKNTTIPFFTWSWCHCFPHLSFFSALLFHGKASGQAASLLPFLPSSTAFGLIPSAAPPPADPLRPVLLTFPAVGNHAGAWLADKPSCWLMGRPACVQLWEGRWTPVKRKRWQSPPHTHTPNKHTAKTPFGRKGLKWPTSPLPTLHPTSS